MKVQIAITLLVPTALGLISVPDSPPNFASDPIPKDLSSFSIELSSFPNYAGNTSIPNDFSYNLLSNLKELTGVWPKVRVGGTTQDKSLFDPDQAEAIKLYFDKPGDDQPSRATYGPAFFESYQTWEGVKFIHGFNFNYNGSDATEQLQSVSSAACTAMGQRLFLSELGNEIDFAPGWPNFYRSPNWTMADYVKEWNWKTDVMAKSIKESCPDVTTDFIAPSFIWTNLTGRAPWNPADAFKLGLGDNGLVSEIGVHNYMNADSKERFGVDNEDLQELLMNHSSIVGSLGPHIELARNLSDLGLPYILSETNSIAGQGRINKTDVLGDALWLVDYTLWVGAHGVKRIHFHQGMNYRYASWQPMESNGTLPTTRPPYYGHTMASHALGNSSDTRIANIPLKEDTESAYAIYDDNSLSRIAILNMQESFANATSRPTEKYTVKVPNHFHRARVDRLIAPGSDSRTNITFGGVSYDYTRSRGHPVVLNSPEYAAIKDGMLQIAVPASSAVLLTLDG
ncbi:hypothetical protein MW887_007184 [Aspergillus wentii]|nr:hypothetical protein MW887_007184 [Aspergillus wentii]